MPLKFAKPRPKLLDTRARRNMQRQQMQAARRCVLKRDGHRCRACGKGVGLEAHHVVMRSLGGTDEPRNLIALCADCHQAVHGHVLILRWKDDRRAAHTVRFEWVT